MHTLDAMGSGVYQVFLDEFEKLVKVDVSAVVGVHRPGQSLCGVSKCVRYSVSCPSVRHSVLCLAQRGEVSQSVRHSVVESVRVSSTASRSQSECPAQRGEVSQSVRHSMPK